MRLVNAEIMRVIDEKTIDQENITPGKLMLRAGKGVADAVERLVRSHHLEDARIIMIAGVGNNGGDIFVAARILREREYDLTVRLAGHVESLKEPAFSAYKLAIKSKVPVTICSNSSDWEDITEGDILVDGLLGTGFSGELRGVVKKAVNWANNCSKRMLIMAVDIPSAMLVKSDITIALGLPKIECILPNNSDISGRIEIVDIGIPENLIQQYANEEVELITQSDIVTLFRDRKRSSHKGSYGHTYCIGGSDGMSGAIILAARAALKCGSGLVTTFVPEKIKNIVASSLPEVMVESTQTSRKIDSIVLGPGMGNLKETYEKVSSVLADAGPPTVLDADGLNVLSKKLDIIRSSRRSIVITPHPGEFATLFGIGVAEVQSDRVALAKMAAVQLNVTCVLKGNQTVVAEPDGRIAINSTGNPGMATAGMGDVLAGIIGGFLAQGYSTFEAACIGVWLHGHSGDLAAAEGSESSLCASDVIAKLSEAFRSVSPR